MRPFCFVVFQFFLLGVCLPVESYSQDFQQWVDYDIKVELLPEERTLEGSLSIDYNNQSSDTLTYIWFHLWPNAYRDQESELAKQLLEIRAFSFYRSKPEEKGFIDSLDFCSEQQKLKIEEHPKYQDVIKVILNEPILPGSNIRIQTPFRVKIPSAKFSRMGFMDNDFLISQWFPKAAVYDKEGWHPMPYLNRGEFYSNFGNYKVEIKLPSQYIVGATGVLTAPAEEIKWLDERAGGRMLENPNQSEGKKTLVFQADSVIDFAWFASPDFLVSRKETVLKPSGYSIIINTYYNKKFEDEWQRAGGYLERSVQFLSQEVGEYPYPQISAVAGILGTGGGMEYPMITVVSGGMKGIDLERVVMHEAFHNWFYGLLATNERRYPWMDEGMVTFFENAYMDRYYPNMNYFGDPGPSSLFKRIGIDNLDNHAFDELAYLAVARLGTDQAVGSPSTHFTHLNYGISSYYKSAFNLLYLQSYLGKESFSKGMKLYFQEWKYKHPYPGDFQKVMERVSGKDLSWFFGDFLNTSKKLDFSISGIKLKQDGSYEMFVRNKSSINAPYSVSGLQKGQIIKTQWYESNGGRNKITFPSGNYDKIVIDAEKTIPDLYRTNNEIKTKGIFKKRKAFELNFLFKLENPSKRQLFWAPVMGYNKGNGYMLGMLLSNQVFPPKRFEAYIMPFFAFRNASVAGNANFYYNFYPALGFIKNIRLGVRTSRFALNTSPEIYNYHRVQPVLELRFRPSEGSKFTSQMISLSQTYINYPQDSYGDQGLLHETVDYSLFRASYQFYNTFPFFPNHAEIKIEGNQDIGKGSIEAGCFIPMSNRLNKGLSIRFFAGTFFYNKYDGLADFRFRLSDQGGSHDYTFDDTFLNRNGEIGTFSGNQLSIADGGFSFPTPVGQTSKYLVSLNLKYSIPFQFPLSVFFDIGTYSGASDAFPGSVAIPYVAGLKLVLIKDAIEINFPVFWSDDIKSAAKLAGLKYGQCITWTFNIKQFDPVYLLRNYRYYK